MSSDICELTKYAISRTVDCSRLRVRLAVEIALGNTNAKGLEVALNVDRMTRTCGVLASPFATCVYVLVSSVMQTWNMDNYEVGSAK